MDSNWTGLSPGPGLKGWLDRLTGPGATSVETRYIASLQFVPSVVAAIAAPMYALTRSDRLDPVAIRSDRSFWV